MRTYDPRTLEELHRKLLRPLNIAMASHHLTAQAAAAKLAPCKARKNPSLTPLHLPGPYRTYMIVVYESEESIIRRPKQESHLGYRYSRRHVQNTTWDSESPHNVIKPRFLKGSNKTGVLITAHVSQVGRWDILDWPLSDLRVS